MSAKAATKLAMLVLESALPVHLKATALSFALHYNFGERCSRPSLGRVAWEFRMSVRKVRNDVNALCQLGVLVPLSKRRGGARHTTPYDINETALPRREAYQAPKKQGGNYVAALEHSRADSSAKAESSQTTVVVPEEIAVNSPQAEREDILGDDVLEEISGRQLQRLGRQLARPGRQLEAPRAATQLPPNVLNALSEKERLERCAPAARGPDDLTVVGAARDVLRERQQEFKACDDKAFLDAVDDEVNRRALTPATNEQITDACVRAWALMGLRNANIPRPVGAS